MARLNDPPSHAAAGQEAAAAPCPTTTTTTTLQEMDALKRRFTRQNRELARTNSAQSLRIRNLETEIARLLAENIALREAAIAAQREAERWQRRGHVAGEVVAMKERLERKLAEVSGLVQELGVLGEEEATARRRRQRRSTKYRDKEGGGDAEDRRRLSNPDGHAAAAAAAAAAADDDSPNQRQTLGGGGVLGTTGTMASGLDQEGRLPPIVEDKLYPRRTLETMEVQALADKGSPDIGPPPVALFDAIDRGSWGESDAASESPQQAELDETGTGGGELDMVALPNNLETRRKRRTSSLLSEMTTPTSAAESDTPALFKSGAKRKLEVTDLDEAASSSSLAKQQQNDDFVYQRRTAALKATTTAAAAGRKSGRFSRLNGHPQGDIIIPPTTAEQSSPQKEPVKGGGTERRVLAPKSTNSPTKKMAAFNSLKGEKGAIDDGGDMSRDRDMPIRPRVTVVRDSSSSSSSSSINNSNAALSNAATKQQHHRQQAHASKSKREYGQSNVSDSDAQPKTPYSATDAVLSPPSTSAETPSSSQPSSKGGAQHQEAALINSVEDVLNGSIGRASRRARAAVSYAEPNLRDKMRRPGKELVSAVEGIERQKHHEAGAGAGAVGESAVKAEGRRPMSDMRLKEEPASPLGGKNKLPLSTTDDDATTAVVHTKRKKNERGADAAAAVSSLAKEVDRLAIFDPPSDSNNSSPPVEAKRETATATTATTTATTSAARPSRPLSRRQSTVDSSHARKGSSSTTTTAAAAALKHSASAGTVAGSDRFVTRRRSMMI